MPHSLPHQSPHNITADLTFNAHAPKDQYSSSIQFRRDCMVSRAEGSKTRAHGIMDSGTTDHTSGRKKLFPTEFIEQENPPVRVEVASGVSLAVAARGTMGIKVWKYNSTSAKKAHMLHLKHALYVPDMPVTLISTKALFKMKVFAHTSMTSCGLYFQTVIM